MGFKVKLVNDGMMPQKQHENDACFDCYANEEIVVNPGSVSKVSLGFTLGLPNNYEAIIRPRSGLTSKGIIIMIGTIDSNYRGEVCAIVFNTTNTPFTVHRNDRVCQMAIREIMPIQNLEQVEELDATDRGDNGFGSTGL